MKTSALNSRLDGRKFDFRPPRLELGWITVFGLANHLSISPSHPDQVGLLPSAGGEMSSSQCHMPFGVWTRVGPKKHVLDGGAPWRNLANTIEPSTCGGGNAVVSNYFDQTSWHGTKNGITELSQTAPPIFGWAAITLGIGPHSSFKLF